MSTVDAPIGLKTNLPDELVTVQLERYVPDGAGNHMRRRVCCPVINNENDPELACCMYEEFCDISNDTWLHLDSGPLKFEYFLLMMANS